MNNTYPTIIHQQENGWTFYSDQTAIYWDTPKPVKLNKTEFALIKLFIDTKCVTDTSKREYNAFCSLLRKGIVKRSARVDWSGRQFRGYFSLV